MVPLNRPVEPRQNNPSHPSPEDQGSRSRLTMTRHERRRSTRDCQGESPRPHATPATDIAADHPTPRTSARITELDEGRGAEKARLSETTRRNGTLPAIHPVEPPSTHRIPRQRIRRRDSRLVSVRHHEHTLLSPLQANPTSSNRISERK